MSDINIIKIYDVDTNHSMVLWGDDNNITKLDGALFDINLQEDVLKYIMLTTIKSCELDIALTYINKYCDIRVMRISDFISNMKTFELNNIARAFK